MIHLENCWTNLDEIWYGFNTIQMYCEMVLAYWMGQRPLDRAEHKGQQRWDVPGGGAECGRAGNSRLTPRKKRHVGQSPWWDGAPKNKDGVPTKNHNGIWQSVTGLADQLLGENPSVGRTCWMGRSPLVGGAASSNGKAFVSRH
jgi:hypothetical protein